MPDFESQRWRRQALAIRAAAILRSEIELALRRGGPREDLEAALTLGARRL